MRLPLQRIRTSHTHTQLAIPRILTRHARKPFTIPRIQTTHTGARLPIPWIQTSHTRMGLTTPRILTAHTRMRLTTPRHRTAWSAAEPAASRGFRAHAGPELVDAAVQADLLGHRLVVGRFAQQATDPDLARTRSVTATELGRRQSGTTQSGTARSLLGHRQPAAPPRRHTGQIPHRPIDASLRTTRPAALAGDAASLAAAEEHGAEADQCGEATGDEGKPGRGHPVRHDRPNEKGIGYETHP
jgi:hypothetical protein